MKTNITISLDARRKRKDGTCPIIFRLSHHRKTTAIPSGISLFPGYRDQKKREVKRNYQGVSSVTRLNNMLTKKKTEFTDCINALEEEGRLEGLSILELKNTLSRPSNSISFFEFTKTLIAEMKEAKKFGNARAYQQAYNVLKTFNGTESLRFEEITYQFLKRFETAHLKKGNSINGLSVYLRTLRAIYNKAITHGLVARDRYPFSRYRIKSEPTAKRAISKEKIKRILELELETASPLFHARNYFICSYLMNGISFIDMAFLRLGNIVDERIQYRRQKTGKMYDIKITEQLSTILDFYFMDKKDDDFIFPIIKRTKLENQHRDIRDARIKYNRRLKEIAKLCDIEENLTSYVSRHSMATNLILSDVPINALRKMLVHSDLQTTQIYIKDLPTHIMDEYQERLQI